MMSQREKFTDLAGQFRRIAEQTCDGQRELLTAEAWGGKLLAKFDLLPNGLEPPKTESTGPSSDYTPQWRAIWVTFISVLSIADAIDVPANPMQVEWEHRYPEGAERWSVGKTLGSDWRIRATNYARIATWIAEQEPAKVAHEPLDPISKKDIAVILGNEVKTVHNRSVEWKDSSGQTITEPYSYAIVRPHILKTWPKKSAYFPESYDDLQRILFTKRGDYN